MDGDGSYFIYIFAFHTTCCVHTNLYKLCMDHPQQNVNIKWCLILEKYLVFPHRVKQN